MPAEQTSEAVVLRRTESGETDRRLTLLTAQFGKLDVIAKGAKKPGSRLAGSSEPLVKAVFTWAEGRVRRYVTQVQPLTSYPGIRSDYDKTVAGLALAELAAVSIPYESHFPQSEVYAQYVQSLEAIERAEDWRAAMLWAETRLMESEGVHPEWTKSVVSGAPLGENPAWVSPMAGGYVTPEESVPFADRTTVSAESLIALDRIVRLSEPPQKVKGVNECLRVMLAFWRSTLEHRLPANESMVRGLQD